MTNSDTSRIPQANAYIRQLACVRKTRVTDLH